MKTFLLTLLILPNPLPAQVLASGEDRVRIETTYRNTDDQTLSFFTAITGTWQSDGSKRPNIVFTAQGKSATKSATLAFAWDSIEFWLSQPH